MSEQELLPTQLECSIHQNLIAYLNDKKDLFEATASILAKVKQHYEKELLMAEGYMEVAKEAVRVDTLREVEDISWVETINYKNPKRVMFETEWETLKQGKEQDVRTQRD